MSGPRWFLTSRIDLHCGRSQESNNFQKGKSTGRDVSHRCSTEKTPNKQDNFLGIFYGVVTDEVTFEFLRHFILINIKVIYNRRGERETEGVPFYWRHFRCGHWELTAYEPIKSVSKGGATKSVWSLLNYHRWLSMINRYRWQSISSADREKWDSICGGMEETEALYAKSWVPERPKTWNQSF